jgi:hypothetical protein
MPHSLGPITSLFGRKEKRKGHFLPATTITCTTPQMSTSFLVFFFTKSAYFIYSRLIYRYFQLL